MLGTMQAASQHIRPRHHAFPSRPCMPHAPRVYTAAIHRHRSYRPMCMHAAAVDMEANAEEPSAAVSTRRPFHQLHILWQDDSIIAVDKPQGFYVHPREDGRPTPPEENTLYLLKRQLKGQWLWPVHRLDRATSGVVVYCLTEEAAQNMGRAMRERAVRKSYYALVRGWTDTYGKIDDDVGGQPSCTLYETLARCQIPLKVGRTKHNTSRYSLIRAEPLTGRFHQIRRHLNYIAHPIVGDSDHGDRYHNRAFRNDLQIPGLYLRAASIEFQHPATGQPVRISIDSWEERWHAAFNMVGLCPCVPPTRVQQHTTAAVQPLAVDSLLQQAMALAARPVGEGAAQQQTNVQAHQTGVVLPGGGHVHPFVVLSEALPLLAPLPSVPSRQQPPSDIALQA